MLAGAVRGEERRLARRATIMSMKNEEEWKWTGSGNWRGDSSKETEHQEEEEEKTKTHVVQKVRGAHFLSDKIRPDSSGTARKLSGTSSTSSGTGSFRKLSWGSSSSGG